MATVQGLGGSTPAKRRRAVTQPPHHPNPKSSVPSVRSFAPSTPVAAGGTESRRRGNNSPAVPQGAGHQHRLVCGCNILAGPYAPLEIKWCASHLAAHAMKAALQRFLDSHQAAMDNQLALRSRRYGPAWAKALGIRPYKGKPEPREICQCGPCDEGRRALGVVRS